MDANQCRQWRLLAGVYAQEHSYDSTRIGSAEWTVRNGGGRSAGAHVFVDAT